MARTSEQAGRGLESSLRNGDAYRAARRAVRSRCFFRRRRGRRELHSTPIGFGSSTSTSAPSSMPRTWMPRPSTRRSASLHERRLRHDRDQEPGRQALLGVGILNRLQPLLRRQPRLFRLRPDRWAERSHLGPGRLVLRREHDGRRRGHREERGLHLRGRHPRR